jgi:hypothetical protein
MATSERPRDRKQRTVLPMPLILHCERPGGADRLDSSRTSAVAPSTRRMLDLDPQSVPRVLQERRLATFRPASRGHPGTRQEARRTMSTVTNRSSGLNSGRMIAVRRPSWTVVIANPLGGQIGIRPLKRPPPPVKCDISCILAKLVKRLTIGDRSGQRRQALVHHGDGKASTSRPASPRRGGFRPIRGDERGASLGRRVSAHLLFPPSATVLCSARRG